MNDRVKQEEKAVRRSQLRASLWAVVASMATSSFLPGTLQADWPLGPFVPAPNSQETTDQPILPPLPVGIHRMHQLRLVSGTISLVPVRQIKTVSDNCDTAPQIVLRQVDPPSEPGAVESREAGPSLIVPSVDTTLRKHRFQLSDLYDLEELETAIIQAPEAGYNRTYRGSAAESSASSNPAGVAKLLRIAPHAPLRVSDRSESSRPVLPLIEVTPLVFDSPTESVAASEQSTATTDECAQVMEALTNGLDADSSEVSEKKPEVLAQVPTEKVVAEPIETPLRPASKEAIGFAKVASVPVPEAVRKQGTLPRAAEEISAEPAPLYQPRKPLVIDVASSSIPSAVPAVGPDDSVAESMEKCFHGPTTKIMTAIKGEATSIQPSQVIRRVSMQNEEICDVVLVGPYKLLLIGRQEGVTRLAIWSGDASAPEIREVHVVLGQPQAIGASMDAVAERLTATITATFPGSQVRVIPAGDGLAVTGRAADSRAARAIIRLVRTACLKTVSDQLEVR